ncbi:hypothetical protein GCM10011391_35520 [Pullulanibacillus camelliae]|uniref:Transposase n=1 Tax=Pullulanibacillus camelliae TaxID=1707096 RepID=A0A8J2YMQ4_9BACL|nr:transposase [Pullulanibacillus camelliae]GGE53555.1 hypothetical protein GCM10011391_35520 [Pullulanibacillus camelliae]
MPKKRFTPEQKADIVIKGLSNTTSVKELCVEVGIQPKTFYDWKQVFMKHGTEGFKSKGDQTKDQEKETMKKEMNRLKELVADLSLENHILKKNDL